VLGRVKAPVKRGVAVDAANKKLAD
jgi:hypothetical protein